MSANVVQLERLFRRSWDWSPTEVAEFYRVKSALIQAGVKIDTERGVSDEGDPWFAFCRPDDGEVIVHIARIGGLYVLAGPSYEGVSTGRDIATLVRDLVGRHPLIQTRGNNGRHGSNIFLHPAALLIAVVATAFFKSTEARALTDDHKSGDGRSGGGGTAAAGGGSGVTVRPEPVSAFETQKTVVMDAVQSAVILSAIAAVLQTQPTNAPQQTVTNAVAANSELLDFGALAPPAPHSVGGLPDPASFEAQGMAIQNHLVTHPVGVFPTIATAALTAPAPAETSLGRHAGGDAPPVVGEALPLVVVLWDLPASRSIEKAVTHEVNAAPAAPTVNMGPAAVQSPVVTFKLALASQPNESMPVVQTAKITSSGTQSVMDAQTASDVGQLSKALANAIKDSTHTKIEAQPVSPTTSGDGVTGGSFASSDHLVASKPVPPTGSLPLSPAEVPKPTSSTPEATKPPSATAEKPPSATTEAPTAAGHTTKLDQPSSATPTPAHPTQDVSALVQDFFQHTPSWSEVGMGTQIVVYDTVALSSHPQDVKSVTFDFADGSTLSLVGLPAALPHSLIV